MSMTHTVQRGGSASPIRNVAHQLLRVLTRPSFQVFCALAWLTSHLQASDDPSLDLSPIDGLVSVWRAEGNGSDSVGHNDSTRLNAAFQPGKLGQAFAFDGAGTRVEFGDAPTLRFTNHFSFDFWIYVNAATPVGGGQVILFRGDLRAGFDPYAVAIGYPQDLIFKVDNEKGESTSVTTSIPLTSWTHVAAVFADGKLQLYLNGSLSAENSGTVYPFESLRSGGGFSLGNTISPANFPLNGLLDEVGAYSRALSAADVEKLYRLGGHRPCPDANDYANLTPEEIGLILSSGCSPPPIHAARATAQVVNGFVVGFDLIDRGYGYTNEPIVQIVGGGGTGAQASTVISNGVVVAVHVESTGKGYSETPRVLIASPHRPPELSIRTTRVAVEMKVNLGQHYQLYSSVDLQTWIALGSDFIAEDESIVREFETGQTGQYFRLVELP